MENYTNKVEKMGVIYYFNHKEQIHRLDGPAIVWAGGSEHWYMHGCIHRLDGPAIIWSSRIRQWYIYNTRYSKSKHNRLVLFYVLEPRRIDLSPTEDV